MAVPNLSELATATIERRSGKVRDNISNNNALLMRLMEKEEEPIDGGRLIYEEVYFQENSNGNWYNGYDQLAVDAVDTMTAAEYDWKQYAVAVTMSGREELINSGEDAVFNLLSKRIDAAEITMANAIEDALFSDGTAFGGNSLVGLDALVPQDPTTGTYGGINRATYTFWRSQLHDPSSTPTASTIGQAMNTLWISCVRGTDRPNLILAGGTTYNTYWQSLQAIQRIGDPKMGELGFTTVKFNTADVVLCGGIGGQATATDMYFLNTRYIHWRPHKRRNMVPIGGKRMSVNQDATVEILGFMGALTCSGSQFQGRGKFD